MKMPHLHFLKRVELSIFCDDCQKSEKKFNSTLFLSLTWKDFFFFLKVLFFEKIQFFPENFENEKKNDVLKVQKFEKFNQPQIW